MAELKKAILLNRKDNVATVILHINKDEKVLIIYNNEIVTEVTSLCEIDTYHKIAITPVEKGNLVYKYGEVIGRATESISVGQHVHINNVESVMTK